MSSKLDPFWPWKPLHLQWKDRKEHKTKHGHCNSGITTMPTTLRLKDNHPELLISITATSKAKPPRQLLAAFYARERPAKRGWQPAEPRSSSKMELHGNREASPSTAVLASSRSTPSISFNLLVKFHPIKPHPGEEPNRSSIGCWCCHSAYCIVLYSYRGSGRIHTYYYNDY